MSKTVWLVTTKQSKRLVVVGDEPTRNLYGEWELKGTSIASPINDHFGMHRLFGVFSKEVKGELEKIPAPKPEDNAVEAVLKIKTMYYESKCSKED